MNFNLVKKLLGVLFLLLFSGSVALAASTFKFEFYNFETGKTVSAFPFGHQNEVIVASSSRDVRGQLPIGLSLKINGQEVWSSTIPNNPSQNCRGADGCSTRGPVVNDPGQSAPVELTAAGKDGKTIATYTSGTAAQPQSDQETSWAWFNRWWYAGLIFGFLLFIPWAVVGWEWWRGRFWVFAWPWPWWFWIPFIWFIPWLFFWWWGDWWFWWAWFWWLWPWGFWIGWWVVFLKHALMWVNSRR